MTPTNGVEISRREKVTVLIRCRFDFNLTEDGGYGKEPVNIFTKMYKP